MGTICRAVSIYTSIFLFLLKCRVKGGIRETIHYSRILYTPLTLFGGATILFFFFLIMPVTRWPKFSHRAWILVAQARRKEAYGLDKPLLVQHFSIQKLNCPIGDAVY